jgi:hypothetical protein
VRAVRHSLTIALVALTVLLGTPGTAAADSSRCADLFPDVSWVPQQIDGPTALETAGMNDAESERFARVVADQSQLIESEIGGLSGSTVCLATTELAAAFSAYAPVGQRLHAGVFAEERVLVLAAMETRMIDDAIAFGLPQLALAQVASELGIAGGYPEPLGSTIAYWYLARATDRLERYRSGLVISMFLDDPNPEERTDADAVQWVSERKPDPSFFDPQFLGSPMGVFIDYAVSQRGIGVLRDLDQATWAGLEKAWRISIRDQYPRGNFGIWWGVGIVVVFVLLALLLAWLKRRENRLAAARAPTPPPDEALFGSGSGGG